MTKLHPPVETTSPGAALARPALLHARLADTDFVDRVWAYLLTTWPQRLADIPPAEIEQLKLQIRREEGGESHYIATRRDLQVEHDTRQILSLFNGRNASEVARQLGCSRAKVYRVLKQAGQSKP